MITKEKIEFLAKAVGILAFVFTALTYANNLRLSQAERLYSETKALMAQYDKSGVRRLENTLIQRLLYYTEGGGDLNDPADFPEELFNAVARETLFANIGEGFGGDLEVRPFVDDLNLILDFYAQVDFCLEADMCDRNILMDYFCPRAREFQSRHKRLIEFYRAFEGSGGERYELHRFNEKCDLAKV